MPRLNLFIPILLTLQLGFACKTNPEPISARNQAIQYLNQREYQKAVPLLEQILEQDPADHDAKILLASAYTGAVGLNMIDSHDLFISLLFKKEVSKAPKSNNAPTTGMSSSEQTSKSQNTSFKKEVLSFLNNMSTGFYFVFALPNVKDHDRKNLEQAIQLLQTIPKESNYYFRGQTFTVIIKLNQFANFINDSFVDARAIKSPSAFELVCTMDVKNFLRNFKTGLLYFESAAEHAVEAATFAGKKPSDSLNSMHSKVKNLIQQFESSENDLNTLEKAMTDLKEDSCEV